MLNVDFDPEQPYQRWKISRSSMPLTKEELCKCEEYQTATAFELHELFKGPYIGC
jgi:hypothetical protein